NFNSFNDVPTQKLASAGTYTLLVEGYSFNTSPVNYSFNVQKVTNTTAALTLGSQVNGAITHTGQQSSYTFSLSNPSQLYFDSLTNDFRLAWSLTGPRGAEVTARSFTSSDSGDIGSTNPVLNLLAGAYTLSVVGTADHTGSYAFRLSTLASATALSPGTVVSDTLSPGNATKLYQFGVNAGDRFYFDEQSQGSGSVYWRLIHPYGQQIWFQSFTDVPSQVLASTGTYTLLIEGEVGNTSSVSYRFNLNFVPLAPPIQITGLGQQPAPDLVVTNLAVSANGPVQSGSQVTVSWTDAKAGTEATYGSWTDQVLVRNSSNEIIASVTLSYDQAVSGPLAAGATVQRQATLRLPDGQAGAGVLTFSVTVDALNGI